RINKARVKPVTRARSCCAGGNLSTRMAIKTRLSIPRTISKTTEVSYPTQAEGSSSHSISLSGSNSCHHARKYFWCRRHHVARIQPGLFPLEISNKPASLQYQQTACSHIPRLKLEATKPI